MMSKATLCGSDYWRDSSGHLWGMNPQTGPYRATEGKALKYALAVDLAFRLFVARWGGSGALARAYALYARGGLPALKSAIQPRWA